MTLNELADICSNVADCSNCPNKSDCAKFTKDLNDTSSSISPVGLLKFVAMWNSTNKHGW